MIQNPGNMEHDYFDKKMQELLSQSPDSEPSATELEDMRQRLAMLPAVNNNNSAPTGGIWKKWWPLLLLLLSLSIGYWSFLQNQRITELEKLLRSQSTHKTDTLFIERTTHQIDTIYHYTIQKNTIETSSPAPNYWLNSLYRGQEPFFNYRDRGLFENLLGQAPTLLGKDDLPFTSIKAYSAPNTMGSITTDSSRTVFGKKGAFKESVYKAALFLDPIATLPSIPTSLLASKPPIFHPTPLPMPSFKKKRDPFGAFRPEGLNIGLHLQPLTLFSEDNKGFAGGAGAQLQVHLPGERRLGIGTEFLFHNFEAKNNLELFPSDTPENPTDVLQEIYGRLQFIQSPVLLEQRFRTQGRWIPSLQVGWVAYRPIQQEFRYEYFSTNIGDYNQSQLFDDSSWLNGNWRLGLSVERQWQKNWSSRIQLQYQHTSASEIPAYLRLRYFGLQLSMQRRM